MLIVFASAALTPPRPSDSVTCNDRGPGDAAGVLEENWMALNNVCTFAAFAFAVSVMTRLVLFVPPVKVPILMPFRKISLTFAIVNVALVLIDKTSLPSEPVSANVSRPALKFADESVTVAVVVINFADRKSVV